MTKLCAPAPPPSPAGARVDVEDKERNTALHIAARHGHASVTKTLACNGANLMKRGSGGMLPVHMACLSGYSDCVETLLPPSEGGREGREKGRGNGEREGRVRGVQSEREEEREGRRYAIFLLSLCVADHDLPSEVDSENRTCLHAAACGGYARIIYMHMLVHSPASTSCTTCMYHMVP